MDEQASAAREALAHYLQLRTKWTVGQWLDEIVIAARSLA